MKFFNYIRLIRQDYASRYSKQATFLGIIKAYILDINFRVVVRFRIQSYFSNKNKLTLLFAILIRNGSIKKYGVEIGLNTKIEGGLNIHHVNGIVIGEGVIIGKNLNIFQQVTIGKKESGYPVIGDDVTIYPGAKIIGNIKIGNNSIIGANSVVNKDVAEGKVVAGVPARDISKK